MQVKEIDINTGKIKGYGICKKKYKISFLGGLTTPTYSIPGKSNRGGDWWFGTAKIGGFVICSFVYFCLYVNIYSLLSSLHWCLQNQKKFLPKSVIKYSKLQFSAPSYCWAIPLQQALADSETVPSLDLDCAVKCSYGVKHCNILKLTALYYTVINCTALCIIVLHYTALHCIVLHCTTLHCFWW